MKSNRDGDIEKAQVLQWNCCPSDDGFEEPNCFERLMEGTSRRRRDCTREDVACGVLCAFTVVVGSLIVWAAVEGSRYNQSYKYA